MRLLLILAVLTACAHGEFKAPTRAGDRNAKIVAQVADFVSPSKWRASGYARPTEVETPVQLVLSADGTVCAVMTMEIEPIRIGDYYACKTQWRIRRR